MPFENEIQPVPNHSHPDHLGPHNLTELEPQGEVEGEDVAGVPHRGHEVEEVMVVFVVALEVLDDLHPTTVDEVHRRLQ